MAHPGEDDRAAMSHQPKKKRVEDQPLPPDVGQKPIQLQRRRVWRACESCRRKKIKCDGCEPICSQCANSGTQCTWLQTKDRAALSRHYVQELEARLLHMESVFQQLAPTLQQLNQSPNGANIPDLSAVLSASGIDPNLTTAAPPQHITEPLQPGSPTTSDKASSNSPQPIKVEDDVSESFGQLTLDERGHLRWIGGSSTMSLIQSFRALTTSPLNRLSPMEDDPRAPGPSANKLYFPASVWFGKVKALPGPEEVEYPERDLADKLVDAYFARCHFLLPVIDKPAFMHQYTILMDNTTNVPLHKNETPFIALVFAVFACAAQLIEDHRLAAEDAEGGGMGMIYYERALILHYISHASTQNAHVQCFILLSSFLCSVNCLPQAWLLVGQAVRMAQDLGLHRSPRRLQVPTIEKETRRKIWAGVYSLDRMLALALGRPLGVEDADCDVEPPAEVDDEDLPEYFKGALNARQYPSLMSGFVALTSLYKIAGRVLRQVYAIEICKDNLEPEKRAELQRTVESLDKDLTRWCDDLPAVFKSSPMDEKQVSMGAVLCSHYYSILTTLHRNFLPVRRDQPVVVRSTAKAVSSARACIRLAPSIKNVVPPSHHLAFFIQHLFSSAVIILLYAMHVADPKASQAAMEEARSCLTAIDSWEGYWPGARKCKELLHDLANTASAAVQKTAAAQRSPASSTGQVPPSSRRERKTSNVMLPPDVVSTERAIRNKQRRAFSPESHHARRSHHSNPYPVDTHRARSTSRKRGYGDPDGVQEPRGSSSAYMNTLSSSYPGQSHIPSPHSSPASVNSVPSPTMSAAIDPSKDSPPRVANSSTFGSLHVPSSPTNVPLPSSPRFDYNLGMSSNSMGHSPADHWNGANADSNSLNFFPSGSHQAQAQSPYQSSSWQQQHGANSAFLGYDGGMGVDQMSAASPSSFFAPPGLPFRGLDYIRNYTPGGYSGTSDQDALWQTFDAGAFRYDPELPFTIGDVVPDNQVGHG
ncbi:hypothetical protein JAAARDRAFT_52756 [Jaapia argillacea MUCL 33604]|uniref:Zn(2)-C6 fungal-type domain-containing protein n=1 Tax=Jaapia argillacea MUCL 33604 TaxID=933084 RepID=A0A067QF85_9AGAM|nr:hypothetical protein JAAARDRAFT_52756 [Jaapia argillacea MUCL 33604]